MGKIKGIFVLTLCIFHGNVDLHLKIQDMLKVIYLHLNLYFP